MTILPPAASVQEPNDDAVLAEIDKQQHQQSSWISAIVLLVVSLFLFVVASKRDYSVREALILLGVLFFHETGHYLAMRIFGYRNVKMFFIPFFGAAVSGQHYNVAGWKKVVVSLMGPLPGILLAIPLGIIGLYFKKSILVDISVLSLVLNGFNLLPVLPLDGGHVMHTLLFSRHHLLDLVFRILAILALAAIAIGLGNLFLLFIIIPSVIFLPIAYKTAKITTELRQAGFQPTSVDSCNIAPESARTIISKIRQSSPAKLDNRVLAKQTLNVFETLNAKPPGVLLSLLLGLVHVGAIVTVIISVAVFMVIPQLRGLGAHNAATYFSPSADSDAHAMLYPLSPDSILTQSENAATPEAWNSHVSIAAFFDDAGKAREAYQDVIKERPGNVTLIGHTVLVSVPREDSEKIGSTMRRMEQQASRVMSDKTKGALFFSVRFDFSDPQQEETVKQEMDGYLAVAWLNAIAPWDPAYSHDRAQKQRWQLARDTMVRIQSETNFMDNKEYLPLAEKLGKAKLAKDQAQASALQAQLETMLRNRHESAMAKLKAEPADKVDHTLVAQYEKIGYPTVNGETPDGKQIRMAEYRNMARAFGVHAGAAGSDGPESEIGRLSFGDLQKLEYGFEFSDKLTAETHRELPMLMSWLQSQGAGSFRYRIRQFPADDED